jgi:hypothetical protein
VTGESVFSVDKAQAVAGKLTTLTNEGLLERAHLQEWLIANPTVLGEGVMIVTSEFGRWIASGGASVERDRLDILGLDTSGHLVVAELKRGSAPDTVHLQALKYAALVSRFGPEDLAAAYADFLRSRGEDITPSEALVRLQAHAGPLDEELLESPRIVIVAETFGTVLTTTILYLLRRGLPITLLRIRPWRLADRLVVSVSQELPLPDAEDYLLSPEVRRQKRRTRQSEDRRREQMTLSEIQGSDLLGPGTTLTFAVPESLSAESQQLLEQWLDEDPRRRVAEWTGEPPDQAVKWLADGRAYSPSALAADMVKSALGRDASVDASLAWAADDRGSLSSVAGKGRSAFSTPEELIAAGPAEIRTAARLLLRVGRERGLPERGYTDGFSVMSPLHGSKYVVWLNLRQKWDGYRLAFGHDELASITGVAQPVLVVRLPSGSYPADVVERLVKELDMLLRQR